MDISQETESRTTSSNLELTEMGMTWGEATGKKTICMAPLIYQKQIKLHIAKFKLKDCKFGKKSATKGIEVYILQQKEMFLFNLLIN
ncbi:hypothetical protein BpHYR1_035945 [Brachionus plicatilis]|uniref:Uncharacterized protein n=1 Tax=Brachionus plicatilis TaxID=10195 RepID=A0A3M7QSR2_BRAPC|nr:hypothetical protein BpHYR1_035945 [Brachionus plicatilis]